MNSLNDLVNSEQVRCPFIDCYRYGTYNECYMHTYTICEIFEEWYSDLTSEQVRILYKRMDEIDRDDYSTDE